MVPMNSWTVLAMFLLAAACLAASLLFLRQAQSGTADPGQPAEPEAPAHMLSPGRPSELSRQLFQAGFRHPDAPRWFLYVKLAMVLIALTAALALTHFVPALGRLAPAFQLVLAIVLALLAWLLPTLIVDKRRAGYFRRIRNALPDALDFMLVCVEAGQSLDLSIMRVAEELGPVHPDLAEHFAALSEAIALGAARHDAWARMAQETGNDDIRQLASVISQSMAMGSPVAQTLRVFAADLRDRRVRQVEEKANLLPTKMTLGTMMFTVPPLLILLLAPALYRISQSL